MSWLPIETSTTQRRSLAVHERLQFVRHDVEMVAVAKCLREGLEIHHSHQLRRIDSG
jgi:hypothetical protein